MLSKIVSPGDRIEMKKLSADKKKQKHEEEEQVIHYVSQVYDVLNEDELKIAMPIHEGRLIPLPVNSRYELCFFTAGGMYQCNSIITERYKEDGLYVLQVEITSDLKKFQRRQYFRLEITMDILYKVLPKEEVLNVISNRESMVEFLKGNLNKGVALDISGGGIRFTSQEQYEQGNHVLMVLDLKKNGESALRILPGIVLRSERIPHRSDMYEHRVEFHYVQGSVRESLIQFIFEEERRLRQEKKK